MAGGLPRAVATVGYLGCAPFMPGTIASAAAIPAAWLLHWTGGFPLLLGATLAAVALGFWSGAREIVGRIDQDPAEIVIDEVAGQWIALWPLSGGLWWMGAAPHVFPWPGWVGAFVMFRLLDIAKPGPVGWADRRGGIFGIMLDDLLAGVGAALAVALAAAVAHGVLM